MALFNRSKREINAKVVYFGPPLAGKTTTLNFIHRKLKPECRGPMKTMGGQMDRMLFFDFMPPELGEVNDYRVRFHLYTVQGEVTNPSTWKTVLKGADGVVFVGDASPESCAVTRESMENLRGYLRDYGQELERLPCVVQCNKSDLPDAFSPAEMSQELDAAAFPAVKAAARTGEGVLQILSMVVKRIMKELREESQRYEPVGISTDSPPSGSLERPRPELAEREMEGPTQHYAEAMGGASEPLWGDTPVLSLGKVLAVPSDGSLRVPLTVKCGNAEKSFVLSISLLLEKPPVA